jgi:hypothetical protein
LIARLAGRVITNDNPKDIATQTQTVNIESGNTVSNNLEFPFLAFLASGGRKKIKNILFYDIIFLII